MFDLKRFIPFLSVIPFAEFASGLIYNFGFFECINPGLLSLLNIQDYINSSVQVLWGFVIILVACIFVAAALFYWRLIFNLFLIQCPCVSPYRKFLAKTAILGDLNEHYKNKVISKQNINWMSGYMIGATLSIVLFFVSVGCFLYYKSQIIFVIIFISLLLLSLCMVLFFSHITQSKIFHLIHFSICAICFCAVWGWYNGTLVKNQRQNNIGVCFSDNNCHPYVLVKFIESGLIVKNGSGGYILIRKSNIFSIVFLHK